MQVCQFFIIKRSDILFFYRLHFKSHVIYMGDIYIVPYNKELTMSQTTESSTSVVGIILQEFDPISSRYSLEDSIQVNLMSNNVSRGAKNLLQKASPSRRHAVGSQIQLVVIEGHQLSKDPHTEAIRRVARAQGYTQPSLEDALRIFPSFSFNELNPAITSVWVMHHPVGNEILGFTLENGFVKLSSHKLYPREGWFCEQVGFIFRCS